MQTAKDVLGAVAKQLLKSEFEDLKIKTRSKKCLKEI
jgi:hypothetical protein